MQKKISSNPFNGTPEQEAKLQEVIAAHKHDKSYLMAVMQHAQEIYGYLPLEVQKIIARETGVSVEEIFGIVTFYSQFKLNPNGKYAIAVCLGTACYVKGSGDLYEKLKSLLGIESGECTADRKFSLDATRCVGCCGLAPVVTINDDVYGKIGPDDLAGILAKYE